MTVSELQTLAHCNLSSINPNDCAKNVKKVTSPSAQSHSEIISTKLKFKKAPKDCHIRKRSNDDDDDNDEHSSSKKSRHRHSRSPYCGTRKRKRSDDGHHRSRRDNYRKATGEDKQSSSRSSLRKSHKESKDGSRKRKRSRSRDRRSNKSRSRSRSRHHERHTSNKHHRSRSSRQRKSSSSSRRRRSREEGSSRRNRSSTSSTSTPKFQNDSAMNKERTLEVTTELSINKKAEETKLIKEESILIPPTYSQQQQQDILTHGQISAGVLNAKILAEALAIKVKNIQNNEVATLPTYYKSQALNPTNYANQESKRKLLWNPKAHNNNGVTKSKFTTTASSSLAAASTSTKGTAWNGGIERWSGMSLGDEQKDKKFQKLMGIKSTANPSNQGSEDFIKKQQEISANLYQQYDQARTNTHTKRGVGLGFSNQFINPNK